MFPLIHHILHPAVSYMPTGREGKINSTEGFSHLSIYNAFKKN